MKNNIGKIIEIHFDNEKSFYVGEVINETNKYIIINMVDPYGRYDGKLYIEKSITNKFVTNSKYLSFIKRVYNGKNNQVIFKNKNDFIQYELKNNKMLSISCSKWLNIRNMKLIKFENNELTCQFINQIGERKKIYKLTLDKIDQIEFDSLELRMYENFLTKINNYHNENTQKDL